MLADVFVYRITENEFIYKNVYLYQQCVNIPNNERKHNLRTFLYTFTKEHHNTCDINK